MAKATEVADAVAGGVSPAHEPVRGWHQFWGSQHETQPNTAPALELPLPKCTQHTKGRAPLEPCLHPHVLEQLSCASSPASCLLTILATVNRVLPLLNTSHIFCPSKFLIITLYRTMRISIFQKRILRLREV